LAKDFCFSAKMDETNRCGGRVGLLERCWRFSSPQQNFRRFLTSISIKKRPFLTSISIVNRVEKGSLRGCRQKESLEMATTKSGGSKRGFAAMDPAKQREIASKGGKASHGGGRKAASGR